jgi:hypothetical protein
LCTGRSSRLLALLLLLLLLLPAALPGCLLSRHRCRQRR